MEKKIILEEDLQGLLDLIEADDDESRSLGYMILENCDWGASAAWMFIIYKKLSKDRRSSLPNHSPLYWRFISLILKVEIPHVRFTSEDCYEVLNACADNEAPLAYMEREFAEDLRQQMIDWGYPFLENYTLTLIKND